MSEEVYRTKVNIAWHILVIGMVALLIVCFYYYFIFKDLLPLFLFLIGLSLFVIALPFYMFYKIKYVFKWNSLSVVGIFTNLDIPYSSITEVKETSSFFTFYYASYTLMSLDQLDISFDNTSIGKSGMKREWKEIVTISPKMKEEFIARLEAKLNGIKVIRKKRRRDKMTN